MASLHVLLVEDHAPTAKSLAALLRDAGYKVRSASDGVAGLAAAQQELPDVILLDLDLPGMDGYEVAQRLRQLPFARRPSIIAVTGFQRQDQRKHSYEVGIDCHFTKPVDPAMLLDMLERFEQVSKKQMVTGSH